MSRRDGVRMESSMANPLVKQLLFQQFKDGVYLLVPPSLKGQISIEDVREELFRKRIVNADFGRIQKALEEASGELTYIGPRFERYRTEKDRYIHVRISDDGVHAFLTVRFPPEDEPTITAGDLEYKLWERNVRIPLDREKIQRIAERKQNVMKEVVATGKPPVPGKDGRLIYHVKVENDPRPLILENGRVDFHRINSIRLVEKDQLLVTRVPPEEGKPGTNVFGEPIWPEPVKDVKLPRGMNTYLSPDETKLFAKIDGHLYSSDGLLHIESVFVVRKHVDFSTGDIHYIGDVIVNGDVKTGFAVETKGNILIRGNVDGATLVTEEGDIVIEGGVFGKKKAVLQSGGNIRARFIQQARVSARGDVEVDKYLLGCQVICEGVLRIPNGSVIGGHVKSNKGILAKEIGSPKSAKTYVEVGRPIDPKIWLEALALNRQIKLLEKKKKVILEQVEFTRLLKKRLKRLAPEKQKEMEALLLQIKALDEKISTLSEKKNELLGDSDVWFEQTPFIQANAQIFPGVVISMNQFIEEITARIHSVKYLLKATGVERKTLV